MIKTIILDFGNVIAFFSHRLTSQRWAGYADASQEEIHGYLFGGNLEMDFDSGRLSSVLLLRQVRERFNFRCSDEALVEAFADIFRPNPEVCLLVPRLKPRYRLLLASNTNELHCRQFQQQFSDTLNYFDAFILSHEIGVCKPQPAFFQHCLNLANADPGECLFIDDMPQNVTGAHSCGLQAILYSSEENLPARLANLGVILEGEDREKPISSNKDHV
jgi:putative hydrolase of the HAD superfamily